MDLVIEEYLPKVALRTRVRLAGEARWTILALSGASDGAHGRRAADISALTAVGKL